MLLKKECNETGKVPAK